MLSICEIFELQMSPREKIAATGAGAGLLGVAAGAVGKDAYDTYRIKKALQPLGDLGNSIKDAVKKASEDSEGGILSKVKKSSEDGEGGILSKITNATKNIVNQAQEAKH
jgi:hypothetical protein